MAGPAVGQVRLASNHSFLQLDDTEEAMNMEDRVSAWEEVAAQAGELVRRGYH